ncbi:neuroparsin-A-like [Portunus trituberculatus]|uniref:neuroparsin-A-like n=1 Tax=Portunus trituberculatus TaxID=210409 RepID=UPI001E1CD42A|nr:neuroparsin-A-like [Portunus trituberculatus]
MDNLRKAPYLIMIVSLLFFPSNIFSTPLCSSDNEVQPSECPHGTVTNRCGNTVCAKGLREPCMVYRWERDLCGGGTFCGCGFCMGCNNNLQCWDCESSAAGR